MHPSKENPNNYETEVVYEPHRKGQPPNKPPSVSNIQHDALVPFKEHPFKMYEHNDPRFIDMVESIKIHGVIQPIIVRPYSFIEGKYEILAGHNRVAASKAAGFKDIDAFIRKGLTDDEAMFIVTETNLIQRSFADLKHSERAAVLAAQYKLMKKTPGYRSDLMNEIKELIGAPRGHGTRIRCCLDRRNRLCFVQNAETKWLTTRSFVTSVGRRWLRIPHRRRRIHPYQQLNRRLPIQPYRYRVRPLCLLRRMSHPITGRTLRSSWITMFGLLRNLSRRKIF